MNYRSLKKVNLSVSEIGLGCEHLQGKSYDEVKDIIDCALSNDINIFEVFMSEPNVRENIGKALEGKRDKVIIQGHIGSIWKNGQYSRSRNIDECKFFFEDLLARLNTDYIDIGMIHYVDTLDDFENVFNGEIIEYAKSLKKSGKIKALGMSSHNPVISKMAACTGLLDVLMFSINPAYDILPEHTDVMDMFVKETFDDENLKGINAKREDLYKTCEAMDVSITVMKTLGAGTLLKKETSPLDVALTVSQCINYALDRPAVSSVLIGCANCDEILNALNYKSSTERHYSEVLQSVSKFSMEGKCVYCNHCLPCPSKIDIAKVNKFLDLSSLSDSNFDNIKSNYLKMDTHAENCIECKSCEKNCPFGVSVIEKMRKARETFGI
ncbi:MAG: aldo/keto reductase [Oscillospiraceae bacterium]|nr:aldo/keto reductase [Oscillospiraceae bacterium]